MQSNRPWARVALWGVLGFPALIGQADVAMAQQRLVTSGSSSSLAACVATVQQQVSQQQQVTTPAQACPITLLSPGGGSAAIPVRSPCGCGGNSDIICTTPGVPAVPASCSTPTSTPSTLQPGGSTSDACGNVYTCSSTPTTTTLTTTSTVTSSSAIAACTAAAAAAQNAAFSTQSISIQSATSVLNRLNQLRQINQSSGGTAATPETGGAGGATSSLAGGQPTSLSGSGIGAAAAVAVARRPVLVGAANVPLPAVEGGHRRGAPGPHARPGLPRGATRGVQRPMATKEPNYQPPPSLVVAGWVEGVADYERRGSSTPTALGVLDTGTRTRSGTVQGGLDFNWTRTSASWLDQMVLGIVASRSSAKLDINYGASATLEGWGIGAYWMGVTGPWSVDAVAKLDYFNYTPTGGAPPVPGIPSDLFFTNYTTAGNLNYRIPLGWTTSFIEPTVGVLYVRTDADLAILNRATGDLLRLQGGARLGTTWEWWNGVSVLGMVKLLAYSNVHVSGIAIEAPALGGFGPGLAGPTDEGKLRGEVDGSLDFGLGAGYFLRAETAVRFGNEYFAAGGKLGLRKAF